MFWARDVVAQKLIGVNRICSILGISKATYYNAKDPKETFCKKYVHIKKYILKVIKNHPYYGIRRIKAALQIKYDIFVGRDSLAKLLIYWGLSLPRQIKKRKKSLLEKIVQELGSKVNILKHIKITGILQAVTSDITRLKFKNGYCYLCVHKDVFGQMVYGWAVSAQMNKELVLASLNMMFDRIKRMIGKIPKTMVVHQDQGSQFMSYMYCAAVLALCRISFSTKGTPTDNAGQESFFGRFKDELRIEIAELESIEEVNRFVKRRIKVYNEDRIHTSIGYMPPKMFTDYILKNDKKRFSLFRT